MKEIICGMCMAWQTFHCKLEKPKDAKNFQKQEFFINMDKKTFSLIADSGQLEGPLSYAFNNESVEYATTHGTNTYNISVNFKTKKKTVRTYEYGVLECK